MVSAPDPAKIVQTIPRPLISPGLARTEQQKKAAPRKQVAGRFIQIRSGQVHHDPVITRFSGQHSPLGQSEMEDAVLERAGHFSVPGKRRYADVILSLAEIENELNGPTDKALGYLKQITDRSGVTHTIPADIRTSKDKFKEFLLAERGRELYFEGWRRQDMIRFGKYIEYGLSKGYPAKDYMTLFPIPPKVIIESGGIVKNNPGYE